MLSMVQWKVLLVDMDIIAVFSEIQEEHLTQIIYVLKLLAEARVTIKLKKSQFVTDLIEYLGHVIRLGEL